MAKFELFFPKLMAHEGGYVDNALDPGGETYAGVARVYNPSWDGWTLVDAVKRKLGLSSPVPTTKYAAINKALALEPTMKPKLMAFYERLYWDKLRLDEVENQVLAEQIADHGTSAGTGRPPRMIQFAINQAAGALLVAVDGIIGAKTIKAINTVDQTKLLKAFVQLRRDFYEYRAGVRTPAEPVVTLLKDLHLSPNISQKIFLRSWLARLPKV